MFLFDVGFQLSYCAVIGIVSIHPLLNNLWAPKFFILKKLWQISSVSIAAQIGVLPLSLFYFNQFPSLFLVSNIVILPCLGFILALGVFVIVLSLLNILPDFLVAIYSTIINYLNVFIAWIAQHEEFMIKHISFSILRLVSCYILIIAIIRCLNKFSINRLKYALVSIIILQLIIVFEKYQTLQSNEIIVFHKNRQSAIGLKKMDVLHMYSDLDTTLQHEMINNYTVGKRVSQTFFNPLKYYYQYNSADLLVVDSLGLYNFKTINPKYILLIQSPKINLNRLIDSIAPRLIISDASNYRTYEDRWRQTCLKRKLPFYQIRKKGAFNINLDTLN